MALNRACVKHGWLVLNGHCRSDTQGRATFLAGTRKSVMDLAIVPRDALADMQVQDMPTLWAGIGVATQGAQGVVGGGGRASVWGHRGGCYGSPGLVGNGSRRLSPSSTGASAGIGWVLAALYMAVGVGVD